MERLHECIHKNSDKVAYFFIAFAFYMLIRALSVYRTEPPLNVLLYISISISLMASNVPRVLDLPLHSARPVKLVEQASFCLSVVCFLAICVRYIVR